MVSFKCRWIVEGRWYVDPRLGSFCLLQRAVSISLSCGHTHIYPRDVHVYIASRQLMTLEVLYAVGIRLCLTRIWRHDVIFDHARA
jgi:hypothetical protein